MTFCQNEGLCLDGMVGIEQTIGDPGRVRKVSGRGQEDRNGAERARSLTRRGVSVSHTLLDEPDVREAHLLVQ